MRMRTHAPLRAYSPDRDVLVISVAANTELPPTPTSAPASRPRSAYRLVLGGLLLALLGLGAYEVLGGSPTPSCTIPFDQKEISEC